MPLGFDYVNSGHGGHRGYICAPLTARARATKSYWNTAMVHEPCTIVVTQASSGFFSKIKFYVPKPYCKHSDTHIMWRWLSLNIGRRVQLTAIHVASAVISS